MKKKCSKLVVSQLKREPSVYLASSKDMSYWPVYKWTLWIHRQRAYSSVSLAVGSFLFRDRSIGRTGIQRKSRMSRLKAEGKIEEVKWKRRRCSETFAIARERGRRGVSILQWDREEIFRSSKTRKIATVPTGKDDDEATRATELEKESPNPQPQFYIADETGAIYFDATVATYLWNNG